MMENEVPEEEEEEEEKKDDGDKKKKGKKAKKPSATMYMTPQDARYMLVLHLINFEELH